MYLIATGKIAVCDKKPKETARVSPSAVVTPHRPSPISREPGLAATYLADSRAAKTAE